MKYNLTLLLLGALLTCAQTQSQDKKTVKAQKDFDNRSYAIAIDSYENLVDKGYSEEQIYKNLGDSHYQNANYKDAAGWYEKLVNLDGASFDANYLYRYAQSLKSTKDYKASGEWMQKYRSAKNADIRAQKIAANPDYLEEIEKLSGRYDVNGISVNSSTSDFAPAFKGDELVFSTARDSGIVTRFVHTWNNKPFTNLYVAADKGDGSFGEPHKLSSLNKKTHETSAVFTKDGSTVYFTRNNSDNGKFARDDEGISRLKIYRANLKDGEWTNITELPFNGDDYSAAHPALSPDERKLYFASDMAGTRGESDIFVVNLNEDGSISAPENLGNTINTEARETFPFVSASNVLYFASDGHPGLGGLDIFATSIEDMDNLYIVNAGKPVNTEQDDFAFIINEETSKGFFSSNRDGGQGGDDIYSFIENEPIDVICNTTITGIVKDKKDGSPLANALVTLVNSSGDTLAETTSSGDGSFTLEGDCRDGDYKLKGISKGYNAAETNFSVANAADSNGLEILLVKEIPEAPIGTDLAKFLNIEPVYFDYDKWFIREDAKVSLEKILAYIKEYPDTKIQIGSHTDARASKGYNLRLSDKRANATMEYLIDNGVPQDHLKALGFGETMITNECIDNVKCPEHKHQKNRRSEFIIIEQ